MSNPFRAVVVLTAFALAVLPPPARAEEEEKPAPAKGEVRLAPEKKAEAEPKVEPPRAEAVGALSAPAAMDLDEGPITAHNKTLTWIGFHHTRSYSRLFFKTTERTAVDVVPGSGVITVKLKGTRVRLRNNLRFLDTSYFPSAVWKVVPRQAGDTVEVEIQMREAVSYRMRRRGETIQIDFDLPSKK